MVYAQTNKPAIHTHRHPAARPAAAVSCPAGTGAFLKVYLVPRKTQKSKVEFFLHLLLRIWYFYSSPCQMLQLLPKSLPLHAFRVRALHVHATQAPVF